jgi:2,4-dienoyl-CoA reductase-like NADH-dependent reductase (Old Yellow Enzyme family)
VPCARRIRDEIEIRTGAAGLTSDADYANEIITSGDADLAVIGWELLREPYWPLKAEQHLGMDQRGRYHTTIRRSGEQSKIPVLALRPIESNAARASRHRLVMAERAGPM